MVMVNGLEDPIINAPIPKREKSSKSKTKREEDPITSPLKNDLPDRSRSTRDSKRQSKVYKTADDDVVMVDAGPTDGLDVADGPDDLAFVTKPKGLQRANTASRKPESKMGGLFGAFRKSRRPSETLDRSKAIIEDDVTPRKRTATATDDSAKRARRDERRKSVKPDRAAEGYVYNTEPIDTGITTEAEDAEARREERRAKRAEEKQAAKLAREAELQAIEDRRSKRRKAERDAEAKKQEERDARHAARRAKEDNQDSRRAREEEAANKDLADEVLLKPRTKRRETTDSYPSRSKHRSTTDRRKSYLDSNPQETPPESSSRRPKSSRRKSTAPPAGEGPVDDYFDVRNATTKSSKTQDNDPYGGNDHTSSWVQSQISDPPAPPPVEPTILEADPDLGAGGDRDGGGPADDLIADEEVRRKNRKKRRSKAYVDQIAEEQDERSRRGSKRPTTGGGGGDVFSEGSGGDGVYVAGRERRKSEALGGVKLGVGEKTWDAKTGQGKRSSWFQSFRR